jgi:hypothetical protein
VVFGYDREIYDETGRLVKRVCYYERFKMPPTWKSKLVPTETIFNPSPSYYADGKTS